MPSEETQIPAAPRERAACLRCGRVAGGSGAGFCSAGCALKHAVPVDADGQFPANGALGGALAVGFAVFNQVLLAGLAVWMERRGEAVTAAKLVLASLAAGALVWIAVSAVQIAVGARRGLDHAMIVLSGGVLIAAWFTRNPWCAMGATALLLVWSGRRFFAR